jgi:uncharacterized phiE125 gp8 family phage protein
VTVAEARKQCELGTSTAHDDHLALLIQAARQQWEHDTDSCVMTQVWSVTLDSFPGVEIALPKRPIAEIADIQYYYNSNELLVLNENVFSFDATARRLHLNSQKSWPGIYDRWDAVTITFVCGVDTAAEVPAMHKQAIRLLVGHYFENRDMMMGDAMQAVRGYECLVRRYLRTSYP